MNKLFIFIIVLVLSGCSTYVEETNNQQFKPLRPSFEEFERAEPSNGSIYSTSSSGLFSSDRRAKKVGDILSVTLSETFSSNKAVTNSSAKADVIVTDGFSGNIALKTAEGTANLIKKFFIDEFSSSISGLFMGLLMKRKLTSLKERMDPRTLNGGVFVGLNGLVIKSHGSSDSKSFYSALKLARNMCQTKSG